MRAKRKALHYKEASKAKPAKLITLAAPPQELSDGAELADFARLENEGGVNSKVSSRVEQSVAEISHSML